MLARRLRPLPTLFRIGLAEAVAYRAELLIWILSTTMPLIMLALWSAVARDAPVGRYGQAEFVAYFLAAFIVRQLTGSWVSWEMNFEVRQGTLSARLLRPIPPVVSYAAENLSALPLRLVIALPMAFASLMIVGAGQLPRGALGWALWTVSILGAWMISFLTSFAIGCLSLFIESSQNVTELWLVLFAVFSGYVIPIDLFPPSLRAAADWMPFRYQLGLPVELLTGAHDLSTGLALLGRQWLFVGLLALLAWALWRRGIRRFGAFGG